MSNFQISIYKVGVFAPVRVESKYFRFENEILEDTLDIGMSLDSKHIFVTASVKRRWEMPEQFDDEEILSNHTSKLEKS